MSDTSTTTYETVGPVFPEQIIHSIQLATPLERVQIKGRVSRLSKPFPTQDPKWIYGELAGQDVTISFRCSFDNAPQSEGEYIVFSGYIQVKPSKMHDGLQVLIDGAPVGNWEPNYKASPITYIERQNTALSLSAFIRKYSLKKLLILSSERGESDYMSPVNDNGLQKVWQNVRCKYITKDSILNDLKQAMKQYTPQGVIFIRGGADTAKTMQMWDDAQFIAEIFALDVHFYAAVDHSDKHFMIDKYADESFASPGDFGHKLAQTYQHLQTEQYINQENTRLSQRCEQLDSSIDRIKKRHIKNILIYATVSVILTAVIFIFFVDDYDSLSQMKSIFS